MKRTSLPDGEIWFDTKKEKLYFSQDGKWRCVNTEEPSSSAAYERWVEALDENALPGPLVNTFRAFAWSVFIIAAGGIGFWALNTTLHSMTVHDCEVNKIQAACEDLKK